MNFPVAALPGLATPARSCAAARKEGRKEGKQASKQAGRQAHKQVGGRQVTKSAEAVGSQEKAGRDVVSD